MFRRFGNKGLNALVNILFSTKYTDLCYGYNAFWRHCLGAMLLPDIETTDPQWGDGFEIETLINVRVAASQLKIAEICSYEESRIHGVSNLNAVTDGIRVLRTIRREYVQVRKAARGGTLRTRRAVRPVKADRRVDPLDPEQACQNVG
jgi:hypothetical protein